MKNKIDLHTHSVASPDGGLSLKNYRSALSQNRLQYVAITDHNSIDFAVEARSELGEHIIVGEEIMTIEGELIGLFLSQKIEKGLSLRKTISKIKEQQAVVYVPHPFTVSRSGLQMSNLLKVIKMIDIIEVCNGRAYWDNHAIEARAVAQKHEISMAASSDAHGNSGWGRTYSIVSEAPTQQNLRRLLIDPVLLTNKVGTRGFLYPKFNQLKRKLRYGQ